MRRTLLELSSAEDLHRAWVVDREVLREVRMKRCSKCGEAKSCDSFGFTGRRESRPRKLHSWCRACLAAARRGQPYLPTPEQRVMKNANWRERREAGNVRVAEYLKAHPCVDCGESDIRVLEFDHVNGVKRRPVSQLYHYSEKAVQAEIAKCEVRCSNCHEIRTSIQYGWWKKDER